MTIRPYTPVLPSHRLCQIRMPLLLLGLHHSMQPSYVYSIHKLMILLIRRASGQSVAEGVPSWPAVPYSQLNSAPQEVMEDAPPSPPRFAFNGISTEPPKAFQPKKSAKNGASDESLARKRAMDEDNGLYPALDPSGMSYARFSSESPIIPLSPDPFGRFPSQSEVEYMEDTRQSQVFLDEQLPQSMVSPPDRTSSLTTSSEHERPVSQTPSSRFSMDSVTSEEVSQRVQKSTSTLMSVRRQMSQ